MDDHERWILVRDPELMYSMVKDLGYQEMFDRGYRGYMGAIKGVYRDI